MLRSERSFAVVCLRTRVSLRRDWCSFIEMAVGTGRDSAARRAGASALHAFAA